MDWKLERDAGVPLHRQVENHIKKKIKSGEWPVGTRLPSQRELAGRLNVNRSTIVAAFAELKAQGLILGDRGGGTKVVNNTWGLLTAGKPADWSMYVEAGKFKPNLPIIQTINEAEFLPHVIRMGTGELSPELLPEKKLENLFAHVPPGVLSLGYQEPKGDRRLREQIALYLKGFGVQTPPSCILVVSGALQALQLISMGMLDRGAAVLLEKPSYLYSVHVFQSAGIRLIGLPLDREGMRTEHLASYKKKYHGSLVYTIPSFHNPTGTLMSEKRRWELLAVCQREQLPLLEDDVYRELWLEVPPPLPLKSGDQSGNVLYLGSMSKVLSPGLRIGWIAGPEPVIDRLADIKMQSDYGSSSLSQWAACECFRTGLFYEQAALVREKLKQRRDQLLDLLESHLSDVAEWSAPSGGFYIWLKWRRPLSPAALFHRALEQGVLLNPGILYDRNAASCLRLSFAYAAPREMERAIRILRRLADERLS